MLITKYFLFLHLPKTGGSFVSEVCHRNLPSEWGIGNDIHPHASYEEVKNRFGELPMLCFVRNPWDWYVSWYHYLLDNPPEPPHTIENTPMWASAFEHGKADFGTVVTRACRNESFGNPVTRNVMREQGLDHYSALYEVKVGGGIEAGRVEAGRYENLREDLLAFLDRHEVPIDDHFRAIVRNAPPVRASSRSDYRSYYDEDLRDLVGEKAHALVERYGYSF
jgi:hypothetical protein